MMLQIGDKQLFLNEGDSISFDANRPHGIVGKTLDGKRVQFLAIIISIEVLFINNMLEKFLKQTSFSSQEDFMQENFKVIVPENFNLGYNMSLTNGFRIAPKKSPLLDK